MAVMIAIEQSLLPYTLVFAGPASLLAAVALVTWLLWRQKARWADLGLKRPESLVKTIGLGLLLVPGIILCIAVAAPIATEVFGIDKVADAGASRFGNLEGNLPLLLMWLAISWIHAGFNEELIYRAYFISRLENLFEYSITWLPTLLAVVTAACFFGYRHMYYQGWYGFITTGVIGLFLGAIYVWLCRNNIWPLVIAHGSLDTLGMTLRFLGIDD